MVSWDYDLAPEGMRVERDALYRWKVFGPQGRADLVATLQRGIAERGKIGPRLVDVAKHGQCVRCGAMMRPHTSGDCVLCTMVQSRRRGW